MRFLLVFLLSNLLLLGCATDKELVPKEYSNATPMRIETSLAEADAEMVLDLTVAGETVPQVVLICQYDVRAQELVQDTVETLKRPGLPTLMVPVEYTHVQRQVYRFHVAGKYPSEATFQRLISLVPYEKAGGVSKWVFEREQVPGTCKTYKFIPTSER